MPLVGSSSVTELLGPLRTLTRGDPGVCVAIVDGPIDTCHPCFEPARLQGLLDGWRAADPPGPAAGHGTHIASIVLGGAVGDWTGLAPDCRGAAIAVFADEAGGRIRLASQQSLAHALSLAAAAGADIVNVSAGRQADLGEADGYLTEAVAECRRRGTLVVAAAGNEGCACHHLPAILPDVLVVGALGADGRPLAFSNWGEGYRRNGILAPGAEIVGAKPGGGFEARTGTSFAAAVVSGVAALLLSLARKLAIPLHGIDIRDLLLSTAAPCPLDDAHGCNAFLGGTLRVDAAVQALLQRAGGRTGAPAPEKSEQEPKGGSTMTETLDDLSTQEDDAVVSLTIPNMPGAEHAPEPIAPSGRPAGMADVVQPSACACKGEKTGDGGCGCSGGNGPQKVYALGALWYDFNTEARFDALLQVMSASEAGNPGNPEDLVKFLKKNPIHAQGLTFTLNQEATPIYGIAPVGPFAPAAFDALLEALDAEIKARKKDPRAAGLQRVSLPGFIVGKTRLANYMEVPLVAPDLRGMFRWTPEALVAAVKVQVEAAAAASGAAPPPEEEILNFLARVYYELRNLGVAPEHRAINYAATNAYQAARVFEDAAGRSLVLDTIGVVKSPVCRPDSDCWDVDIRMFDPENDRRAERVYRFTVDVSEVIPVTVGPVRTWAAR